MSIPYSVMQPSRFSVDEVSVRPNPDFQLTEGIAHLPRVDLSAEFGEGVTPDGQPIFRYKLRVKAGPQSPQAPVAYDADVAVIGHFTKINDVDVKLETLKRMASFNGLAMLYGFVRDVVLLQTMANERGPFMLPALDLTPMVEGLIGSQQENTPSEQDGVRTGSPSP